MIQGFYSAAVGAQQQMRNLDIRGNNVANVNTYGYKAQVPAFESLMYGMLDGIDGNQLPRGSGSALALTGTDLSAGAMEQTGRQLDFAIAGEGFFALFDPASGEVSFTRDGSFTLSPFQVEAEEDTGAEPVDTAGGDAEQTPALETRYYLSDGGRPSGTGNRWLSHCGDRSRGGSAHRGLFHPVPGRPGTGGSSRFLMDDKNGAVWMSTAKVQRGYLESSNADLATELTGVIEAQRSYSYALKMVTTADEVETTINNLTNG